MKTYRVPRPLGYLYVILGTAFLIIIGQFYAVGMLFISEESASYIAPLIMLAFAVGFFYGAWYFYRYQIILLETGITISFPFKKPIIIEWAQIETIEMHKRLFLKPKIIIHHRDNDKIKKQKLQKTVEPYPELINELYLLKGIPIPQKGEKYINRTRKGYKRRKEMIFAILYFSLGLGGIMLYRQTITYGPGLPFTFFYILLWMLGHSLLWLNIAWVIKYTIGKAWIIAVLLSIFFLSAFGIYQTIIYARETPMIIMLSVMNAILFSMVIISILKDSRITNKIGYISSLALFLLFYFGYSALVPQANIKQIAELAGPYGSGGTVFWIPDGKEVILDAMAGENKPVWNFISINTTHMVQTPIMDKNGIPGYIYDPIWSPDGTKFLADAFYHTNTAEFQSIILGNIQSKQFRFLDTRIFKRNRKYSSGILNHHIAQPWSPDGKSAIIWRPEYTSDTSELIYKLYYYSFDRDTSKVIYQTKDKVQSAFWVKDTTILYLTYIENKIGRGQLNYQYTLWQINLNDSNNLDTINPKKIYADSDPWRKHLYSPNGKYLYIAIDTSTTASVMFYILDIQNRQKFAIPNIDRLSDGQRFDLAWHPRENKIMYSIGSLEQSDIFELDLSTKKTRKIYTEKGQVRYLSYSGTGNRIAYYVGKVGHWPDAIVSIKTDGTDWRRISSGVQSANFYLSDPTFAWQPNGDMLAFLLVPWTARDIWNIGVYTASFK